MVFGDLKNVDLLFILVQETIVVPETITGHVSVNNF